MASLLFAQALTSCEGESSTSDICEPGTQRECAQERTDCDGRQTCNSDGTAYSTCACETLNPIKPDPACEPNTEKKECPVPGMDCDGYQTCNAEGTGYSACACEDTSAGAGGTDGAGGTSQSNGGTAGMAPVVVDQIPEGVGVPCGADSDCPTTAAGVALLTCITDTSDTEFGLGSPQGGYCSLPCIDNADCEVVDSLSACDSSLPGGGRCIALCTPGAGTLKCGADRAQACFQTSDDPTDAGGCFPVCTSDAACGNGRFCDSSEAGLGLCRTARPQGGGVGAPCTEATEATDCASGVCLTISENGVAAGTFCTAICTLFSEIGCGFDPVAGGRREAACAEPRSDGGQGGDLGFCVQLCDVDTDCAQAGWVCSLFAEGGGEVVGRSGRCRSAPIAAPP